MGGNAEKDKRIPSEEDFARAQAADRHHQRGLSDASEHLLDRFAHNGVHKIFLMYSPSHNVFGAFVFFRYDRLIEEARSSGLAQAIEDAVYMELLNAGRGGRSEIEVAFEFDSHENVERNYEGDYYLRLR